MNTTTADSNSNWGGTNITPEVEAVLAAMREDTHGGPGQYLQTVRNALGLSESQLASQIGISRHQLVSLENNDYDVLPAPIFVKNYLRRYCDAVGLPLDPVIESYEHYGRFQTPTLKRVSIRERLSSRHISARWAATMAVAIVFVLAAFWWQKPNNDDTTIAEVGFEMPGDASEGGLVIPMELPPPPAVAEN